MIEVHRRGMESIVLVNNRPVIVTKNHDEALALAGIARAPVVLLPQKPRRTRRG